MAKLLVVVDYQNDFVNGALGFVKAETLEKGICNKIEEYLNRGDKVIFTYDTHFENYLHTREGKKLPVKHCIIDTEGHDLYGELKKFKDVENTLHYNKKSFGLSPEDMLDIAKKVYDDLSFYMKDKVEYIGFQDILFYHLDAKDRSEEAKRLKVLLKLAKGENIILVTSIEAVMRKYIPKEILLENIYT